jgi:hypothetical protein
MKITLRHLSLAASLGAAIFFSSNIALAQAAGGFSAGPGLAAPGQHEQTVTTETNATNAAALPAAPPVGEQTVEDQGGYITRVTTFRPSPSDTQVREFTQTRLWVLDPGKVTTEFWWTSEITPASGGVPSETDDKFQLEVEMGIARHLQLDIYFNLQMNFTGATPASGGMPEIPASSQLSDHTGVAAELRWAIPDYWGQVFMNPTLYFELQSQYGELASPRAEVRVLLGGQLFMPKLLAAANLLYEQNIFWGPTNTLDMEVGLDVGVNYEVIDGIFRLGAEMQSGGDMHGTRDLQPVLFVGPGFILKTKDNAAKIMFTFLFGTQPDDAKYKPVLIASLGF